MVKVNGDTMLRLINQNQRGKFDLHMKAASPRDNSKIYIAESEYPDQILKWLSSLQEDGLIEYFERDYIGYAAAEPVEAPNDPYYKQQWYLHNDGTLNVWNAKIDADINIPEAWEITKGDENITIAILDTGIGFTEPDLSGRLWQNTDEIEGDEIDNDQNGYIDDVNGYDFVNKQSLPRDDNGHGTGIAGIIAATADNSIGISGINQNSRLMICKVLNGSLAGKYSDWIAAIYYAVENGADIINMSVIGKDDSKLLQEAVEYAHSRGVAIFASMGNEKVGEKRFPAAYSETIAIGSSDPDDRRSTSFNGSSTTGSNYGAHLDFLAPGKYILSLNRVPGATTVWSGTSMSSAVACAVGSLLLSVNSSLTVDELQSLLVQTAKDQIGDVVEDSPGWDPFYGFGRIDAYLALERLRSSNGAENGFDLMIYPNPTVNKTLTAHLILGNLDDITLDILDSQGRVLRSQNYTPNSRTAIYSFSLHDYSSALYYLRITTSKRVYRQRFILY
jgi:subtilisin family serine protease